MAPRLRLPAPCGSTAWNHGTAITNWIRCGDGRMRMEVGFMVIRESRYLTELRVITLERQDLDEHEHAAIDNARAAGATWSQIAAALGKNSPQRAMQRFDTLTRWINARKSRGICV
jgi:hypothetical protein